MKRTRTKTPYRKHLIQLLTQFAKLQLAGNIPFWGTYLGFMLLDKVFHMPEFQALAIATVIANVLFFIVDDKWVFADTNGRHGSKYEAVKFAVFISISAIVVFAITNALSHFGGISPYIGQFISAGISTIWTFAGLRFWVFAPPRHHGLFSHTKTTRRSKKRTIQKPAL